MKNTKSPILILIAGGSASGKTTFANKIAQECKNKQVVNILMDNYYNNYNYLSLEERKKINFDHPDAFDITLLIDNLKLLLNRQIIQEPVYDFKNYCRSNEIKQTKPADIILLEGIFALENSTIRQLSHMKIFIDTDNDLRLARRIMRDVALRGRNIETVINQYLNTVKPMHDAFVEPTKHQADLIIPSRTFVDNDIAINVIATKLISMF